jgi:formylglycine-generating enzyme required for sulfatase activity
MFKKLLLGIGLMSQIVLYGQEREMAHIKGGSYIPLYGTGAPVEVDGFLMDVYPVTNQEFLAFVKKNPRWAKSQVIALFADENYLGIWKSDTVYGEKLLPNAPVTTVSWYAAKDYCQCQGKRLPTVDEWEYAAMASETSVDGRKEESYNQFILNWYETPTTYDNEVGNTFKNYWGVYDLHGLVWEWTLDFNSTTVSGESRKGKKGDSNLFCGAASLGASDLMNYAAFIRYAFRGSLKANYAIKNLGFRCVKDVKSENL